MGEPTSFRPDNSKREPTPQERFLEEYGAAMSPVLGEAENIQRALRQDNQAADAAHKREQLAAAREAVRSTKIELMQQLAEMLGGNIAPVTEWPQDLPRKADGAIIVQRRNQPLQHCYRLDAPGATAILRIRTDKFYEADFYRGSEYKSGSNDLNIAELMDSLREVGVQD